MTHKRHASNQRIKYMAAANMVTAMPGYERDRPEDPRAIDLIRLVHDQLINQGIETPAQYVELLGLHNLGYDILDPDIIDKARFLGELNQRKQTKRDEIEAARPIREPNVYYVRMRDLIKIGYSTQLERRFRNLMVDEVLAIEPGGRELEQMRLRQFAHLRYRGERFHPGGDLIDHIAMIKDHYRDRQTY